MSFSTIHAAEKESSTSPARQLRTITPSDSVDLPGGVRGIYAAVAGDIAIVAIDDSSPVVVTVAANSIFPVQAKRVCATGTTATGLVALI